MAVQAPGITPGLTRRQWAMAVPLLGALPSWAGWTKQAQWRGSRTMLGTRVDIVAEGLETSALAEAATQAFAEMARLESLMSRYQPDSVVARLGAAAGVHPVSVPPEVMAVLRAAKRLHAETDGAFDPTVGALRGWRFEPGQESMPAAHEIAQQLPLVSARDLELDVPGGRAFLRRRGMALDLGGVAKLPILEAGLEVLRRHGVEHALVNGGGDVLTIGRSPSHPWRVGVRHPGAPQHLAGVLHVSGRMVVASSGDYERGFMAQGMRMHHVLSPRTGRPTQGVHGVALLARDVAAVNGLGAATMVRGVAWGRALSERTPGMETLVAGVGQPLWLSAGMRAALQPAG